MRFSHAHIVLPVLLALCVGNWIQTVATAEEKIDLKNPSGERPPTDENGYGRAAPLPSKPTVQLVFDTGSNPEAECKNWPRALELARKMAGCDEAFKCLDVNQKCQKKVRQCSPGCDICENLKAGSGASTSFGPIFQPPGANVYATTKPGFFYGYDSKFDVKKICTGSVFQAARVMVHEAVHACPLAGGSKPSFDANEPLKRCQDPSCCTDVVAPVEETNSKICGE